MKKINLINDLRYGGTEKSLVNYCLTDKNNENIIITFGSSHAFRGLLEKNNIKIYELNFKKDKIKIYFKFRKLIEELKPDIVNSWMYHSHLISFLLLPKKYPLIWSIRNEDITYKNLGYVTFFLVKVLSYMSKFKVSLLIFNSEKSKLSHTNGGFKENISNVVYNGYIPKFNNILLQTKFNSKIIKIASIGRYHDVKNHEMLFKALKIIKEKKYDFTCTLIGSGINTQNSKLINKIINYDLEKNIILQDAIENIESEYCKYDFTILTSKNESFPNVAAESLNYGIPCISTDVGDVRKIFGQTENEIISVNDIDNLVKKIESYIHLIKNEKESWKILKQNSSKQIMNFFSIEQMHINFDRHFLKLINKDI